MVDGSSQQASANHRARDCAAGGRLFQRRNLKLATMLSATSPYGVTVKALPLLLHTMVSTTFCVNTSSCRLCEGGTYPPTKGMMGKTSTSIHHLLATAAIGIFAVVQLKPLTGVVVLYSPMWSSKNFRMLRLEISRSRNTE